MPVFCDPVDRCEILQYDPQTGLLQILIQLGSGEANFKASINTAMCDASSSKDDYYYGTLRLMRGRLGRSCDVSIHELKGLQFLVQWK